MYRTIAAAALIACFTSTNAEAASSRASNTFVMQKSYADALAWYSANREGIYEASNCRIVDDRGNREYLVATDTPLGVCQYIIRESTREDTTRDGRKRTTYHVQYVRNVSGRLDHQDVTIALTDMGDRTEVEMTITTSVTGRLVPVFAVRKVQDGSLQGCENFVTANLQ